MLKLQLSICKGALQVLAAETPPRLPNPSVLACLKPETTSAFTWCCARTCMNRSLNLRRTTPKDMDLWMNPGMSPYLATKSPHNTTQEVRSVVFFVPHLHWPSVINSHMAEHTHDETKHPRRRIPVQSWGRMGAQSTPTKSTEALKLGWNIQMRFATSGGTEPRATAFWKASSSTPSL